MPKTYRKKPLDVQVVLWTGNNLDEVLAFATNAAVVPSSGPPKLTIRTLEGDMLARPGCYIVRGIRGEFYPCAAEIFEGSYDEVRPGAPQPGDPQPQIDISRFQQPMTLQEIEDTVIQQVMQKHKGRKAAVAGELGISLRTLYNRLNRPKAYRPAGSGKS